MPEGQNVCACVPSEFWGGGGGGGEGGGTTAIQIMENDRVQ